MAWNRTTREQYKREAVRYESDLTAAEWGLIEPLIPRQGRLGRPRERDLREVFKRSPVPAGNRLPVAGTS